MKKWLLGVVSIRETRCFPDGECGLFRSGCGWLTGRTAACAKGDAEIGSGPDVGADFQTGAFLCLLLLAGGLVISCSHV